MSLPNGRTVIGEVLWFPYSIFAWTSTLLWLCLVGVCCAVAVLFVPFERFQHRGPHLLTGFPMWFSLGPVRTIEDPLYRRDVVSMFMQNHISMLDGCTATASIRVPLCGLENASHLNVPGYGWIMRCANAIAVDRKDPKLREHIRDAIRDRIARGINVLTFPEGHRTTDGTVRPLKNGVFRMAIEAGIPISPVAVRGAYKLLPKGVFTVRPARVVVYIAPQIETKGLTMQDVPALKERVRTVLDAFVQRGEMLGELCKEPIVRHKSPPADTSAAV
ncbi:MAG: 1-acyl-sn-glycerol-3-phosphate acyltransferase [Nannocystaceae bacterium]|nr:1-acyl-sn-glycerol-3-phosphate acyltransferase [Nannocystaceae bacterium]